MKVDIYKEQLSQEESRQQRRHSDPRPLHTSCPQLQIIYPVNNPPSASQRRWRQEQQRRVSSKFSFLLLCIFRNFPCYNDVGMSVYNFTFITDSKVQLLIIFQGILTRGASHYTAPPSLFYGGDVEVDDKRI